MSEMEVVITILIFTFAGVMVLIIGELCGGLLLRKGHDVEYKKPKETVTPPIPPNARSFGNERPPREMRKPPSKDKEE